MKMFVFNSKREESPGLGLFGMVFFSLRFMSSKAGRSLKSKMPYFRDLGFKVSNGCHFFCDDRQFFIFLQTCAIFAKNISCQLIFNSLFHLAFCNHHIPT